MQFLPTQSTWKAFVHWPDCFSVLRLTLSGFRLHLIFTLSCLGFVPNILLNGNFHSSTPCLSLDKKSGNSQVQTLGTKERADEEHPQDFAFQKWYSKCSKSTDQAGKAVQSQVVIECFERIKCWGSGNASQNDKTTFSSMLSSTSLSPSL